MRRRNWAIGCALAGFSALWAQAPAWAHQPVMDMAPRWQGGYGFQVRHESYGSDKLMSGTSEVGNPFNLDKELDTTWLEGIYTFRRELRLSVKVPYVDQQRTVLQNGAPVTLSGSGLGDVVVGMLFKRYKNQASATGNIALTTSIRLSTGDSSGDYPVGDGSTDFGLSFSKSMERANFYQYYDLFYWENREGDRGIHRGNELGLDVNLGWHPYHKNLTNTGVFVMMDFSLRNEERGRDLKGVTGGKRVSGGPVLVYYRQGMMIRAEYKYPFHEDVYNTQLSRGPEFNVGIGFVF